MSITSKKNPVLAFGELGLIHCLGTAGIPVYTASEEAPNITSYSRYSQDHVTFTSFDSETFIQELNDFGDRFEKKVVIMGHDDRALLNISNNREALESNFLFRLPKKDMVKNILDKLSFIRLCERYDLPAPKSAEVSSMDELSALKQEIKPPYIIKPPYRHYWYDEEFKEKVGSYRKAYICHTFDEMELMYQKIAEVNPSVVIQEYVMGEDHQMYDINLHVTESGEIDGYVIGQKLRVYPPKAGWGSYVRTVFDEEMINLCRSIISKLDLKGMVNIQFKKDERTGEPKLIEIHTRTSIFDYLGASAGQNIPAKYYQNFVGEQHAENDISYKKDVKYINIARDLRLLVRYRKEYDISLMEWLKTYKDITVFDGMTLKDPKALYHELRSALTR